MPSMLGLLSSSACFSSDLCIDSSGRALSLGPQTERFHLPLAVTCGGILSLDLCLIIKSLFVIQAFLIGMNLQAAKLRKNPGSLLYYCRT